MRYSYDVCVCGYAFAWVVYLSFYYCWQVRSEWRLDLLLVRSLRAGQIGRLSEDLHMHSAFQCRCQSPVCHGAPGSHRSLSLASECTGVAKSFFQKLVVSKARAKYRLHNLFPNILELFKSLGTKKKKDFLIE